MITRIRWTRDTVLFCHLPAPGLLGLNFYGSSFHSNIHESKLLFLLLCWYYTVLVQYMTVSDARVLCVPLYRLYALRWLR